MSPKLRGKPLAANGNGGKSVQLSRSMTESQRLLKRMIVSAINARQIEFERVSKLLHDDIGQVLSAVGLHLDVLKLDYKQQVPEIVGSVNDIQQILEQAVTQVRALSYDLNPAVVERAGLNAALDRLAGRYRSRTAGTIRLFYDSGVRPPLEIANTFYKIAELALDNAVRHAQANLIEVQVRSTRQSIYVEVKDDGIGFVPGGIPTQNSGFGLLMMEHYSGQVPITMNLQSEPGQGTLVRATYNLTQGGAASKEAQLL